MPLQYPVSIHRVEGHKYAEFQLLLWLVLTDRDKGFGREGTQPEVTLYKPQSEVLGYCRGQQPNLKHIEKAYWNSE